MIAQVDRRRRGFLWTGEEHPAGSPEPRCMQTDLHQKGARGAQHQRLRRSKHVFCSFIGCTLCVPLTRGLIDWARQNSCLASDPSNTRIAPCVRSFALVLVPRLSQQATHEPAGCGCKRNRRRDNTLEPRPITLQQQNYTSWQRPPRAYIMAGFIWQNRAEGTSWSVLPIVASEHFSLFVMLFFFFLRCWQLWKRRTPHNSPCQVVLCIEEGRLWSCLHPREDTSISYGVQFSSQAV